MTCHDCGCDLDNILEQYWDDNPRCPECYENAKREYEDSKHDNL